MPLKIRLRRRGRKKAPHHPVRIEERLEPPDGRLVATIGQYLPKVLRLSEAQRRRTAVRTEFVRTAFASDAAMARALNVERGRISRWKKGEAMDSAAVERLVALDVAIELLTGFLDDRSIPKWLSGTNAHLAERRPIDVLTQGRLSEVIAAIEAEKSGAYA